MVRGRMGNSSLQRSHRNNVVLFEGTRNLLVYKSDHAARQHDELQAPTLHALRRSRGSTSVSLYNNNNNNGKEFLPISARRPMSSAPFTELEQLLYKFNRRYKLLFLSIPQMMNFKT